jgi:hypothetical protein
VPSRIGSDKMPGPQDVHVEKVLIASDEIVTRGGGVIDVALTSRHECAIECDDLCYVLTDCLQDVSFASAVLCLLFLLMDFICAYLCDRH